MEVCALVRNIFGLCPQFLLESFKLEFSRVIGLSFVFHK